MKTMLTTVTALVLLFGCAAQAADRMPPHLVGEWCHSGETFTRGKCKDGKANDGWMIVRKNGFSGHETECKLLKSSRTRQGSYRAKFWCEGEGATWVVDYELSLTGSQMLMRETGRTEL